MCLSGSALSVEQYAKKVDLKQLVEGRQPRNTLLAWCSWNVSGDLSPELRSATQSSVWTPGKPMTAHKAIKKDGDVVGIHCYKSIDDLNRANQVSNKTDFKQERVVVGQVLIWGLIAEHVNGYRAEFGYPFVIHANGPGLALRLADTYGCMIGRDFIPRLLKAA